MGDPFLLRLLLRESLPLRLLGPLSFGPLSLYALSLCPHARFTLSRLPLRSLSLGPFARGQLSGGSSLFFVASVQFSALSLFAFSFNALALRVLASDFRSGCCGRCALRLQAIALESLQLRLLGRGLTIETPPDELGALTID